MTIYRDGDIVRFKKDGSQFTLDDVNPNPNFKEDGEYFATGNDGYGYGYIEVDSPDDIELVMSVNDAATRKVPTPHQIASSLDLLGDGWNGVVEVTQTEVDGDSIICAGKTSDGLRVSFTVIVSSVFEDDGF